MMTSDPVIAELPCEDRGTGPALVFLHGYLGSSRHWTHQIARFSARRRCLAPDLAGFGAAADLPARARIGAHAEDVLATLTTRDVERFCLLGHSMGGMIAQEIAARAPERVDRLILYGTGPVGLMPDRFEPIEASRQRLVETGLATTARRIVATWFEAGETAPGFALCLAEAHRASRQAALASLSAWENWDGRRALGDIAIPSLILWGDGDRSYPWSQPRALWRGIAGSRLAVVPGCAHAVHLEKPDIFNLLVEDFLSRPEDVSDAGQNPPG